MLFNLICRHFLIFCTISFATKVLFRSPYLCPCFQEFYLVYFPAGWISLSALSSVIHFKFNLIHGERYGLRFKNFGMWISTFPSTHLRKRYHYSSISFGPFVKSQILECTWNLFLHHLFCFSDWHVFFCACIMLFVSL